MYKDNVVVLSAARPSSRLPRDRSNKVLKGQPAETLEQMSAFVAGYLTENGAGRYALETLMGHVMDEPSDRRDAMLCIVANALWAEGSVPWERFLRELNGCGSEMWYNGVFKFSTYQQLFTTAGRFQMLIVNHTSADFNSQHPIHRLDTGLYWHDRMVSRLQHNKLQDFAIAYQDLLQAACGAFAAPVSTILRLTRLITRHFVYALRIRQSALRRYRRHIESQFHPETRNAVWSEAAYRVYVQRSQSKFDAAVEVALLARVYAHYEKRAKAANNTRDRYVQALHMRASVA